MPQTNAEALEAARTGEAKAASTAARLLRERDALTNKLGKVVDDDGQGQAARVAKLERRLQKASKRLVLRQ